MPGRREGDKNKKKTNEKKKQKKRERDGRLMSKAETGATGTNVGIYQMTQFIRVAITKYHRLDGL